jgi:hypothetical protein
MRQLVLALYAEGRTDERFLPVIIQRVASRILNQRALTLVEVIEPNVLKPDPEVSGNAERVLSVAQKAAGYDALIIHRDADARTADNARVIYFEPGLQMVQNSQENACRELLPIIPIRMTEAWMMADVEAFLAVVGTSLNAAELGFPSQPRQVETILDPKHELNLILGQVFTRRRRRKRANLGQYYEPLARYIELEKLDGVPAFHQFTGDLTNLLHSLRLI